MKTPEELIPDEWFETAGELTRSERKERVFPLIYGDAPNTQEMRDRISAYVNYGEPPVGTDLHERIEASINYAAGSEQWRHVLENIPDFADRSWIRERTEAGELTPQDILNTSEEFIKEKGHHPTAEEMADRLGVTMEAFAEVMRAQVATYTEALSKIQQMFVPPRMNRAQRRAAEKARRRRRV